MQGIDECRFNSLIFQSQHLGLSLTTLDSSLQIRLIPSSHAAVPHFLLLNLPNASPSPPYSLSVSLHVLKFLRILLPLLVEATFNLPALRRCNPLLNQFTWKLLPPKLDQNQSFSFLRRCLYPLCYINVVTCNLNVPFNSQGVVDRSLQVYVPSKSNVTVKCYKGNALIQYLSWF